jgi:hypothetical protein
MATFKGLALSAALEKLWASPGMDSTLNWLDRLGGAVLLVSGLLLPKTRYATAVCLAMAAGCALESSLNDDWMPHFRLLTPAMAPLAVAVALGTRSSLFEASQRTRMGQWPSMAAGALFVGLIVRRTYYERDYRFPHTQVASYMKELGSVLALARRADDLLATDMAGIIPYYSGMRTVDVLGLCDAYIARHGSRFGAMGKVDWDYVIRRRPTFYQFNFPGWFRELYLKPAFSDQTEAYWVVLTPGYLRITSDDRKMLIVRKDRPGVEEWAARNGWRLEDPRTELQRLGLWP